MPGGNTDIWSLWREAAGRPMIDAALRGIYARLDADIRAKGPTCWASGKCCKFDEYGHRLYVTGLEITWFCANLPPTEERTDGLRLPIYAQTPGACPYQIDGLCSTHAIRPTGCRIFFCQQGTQAWQQDLYETYLAELRRLHDAHHLPYRYMDWIVGLNEAAQAGPSARG